VFEEPSDFIHVHDASGRSLQVPLRRHGGLIWSDGAVSSYCREVCFYCHRNAG
jgi:hypothetical protein